jgi:nucleotide-binding universal stress UspA family protein
MRVLIATCGLPHSDIAVHQGAQIARMISGRTTILTVIRHLSSEALANAVLTRAVALAGIDIATMHTKIRKGKPAKEIVREIEEGNYELTIVGTRSMCSLLKHLIGSTAGQVVALATCPIMIAKERVSHLNRLLICDRGAESPSLLTCLTDRLAELITNDTEVTVLHVRSQMSAGPRTNGQHRRSNAEELIPEHKPRGELLDKNIRALEKLSIYPRLIVRHGLVVDEILSEARSGNYDLIVIGAPRRNGWQRLMLDYPTRRIINRADRPVLVIK